MNRTRLIALVVSGILVLATTREASAQYPGSLAPGRPPQQGAGPVFSPYLNLLRGGNPAINYYGLVRPEIQFRNALQNLNNELEQTEADVAAGQAGATGFQTGHPVQFFNLSHYYPNSAQGGGGRGAAGNYAVAPTYGTGAQVGGTQGSQTPTFGSQNKGPAPARGR